MNVTQRSGAVPQGDGATEPMPSVSNGDAATAGANAPRSWDITAPERVANALVILQAAMLDPSVVTRGDEPFVAYRPADVLAMRQALVDTIEQLRAEHYEVKTLRRIIAEQKATIRRLELSAAPAPTKNGSNA